MIAAVLFDMNDVLYRYDRGRRVARLAAFSGLAETVVEAAIWGSGYERLRRRRLTPTSISQASASGSASRSPRTPGPRPSASR